MSGDDVRQVRVVDVFTEARFEGNPLGVVLGAEGLSDGRMHAVARELNLSETAFVLPPTLPEADYRIRIWTPARELPFAGHPSVGTCFLLAEEGMLPLSGEVTTVVQECGIGPLPMEIHARDGRPTRVVMTQGTPELGVVYEREERDALLAGLGLSPDDAAEELPTQVASTGIGSLMLPVCDLEALGRIDPNTRALRSMRGMDYLSGIYAFVVGDGAEVRARCFAPGLGIAEDPATGSAAGALGAYLYAHSALALADEAVLRFVVRQGVEMGRPSALKVEVAGEGGEPRRVRVGGAAVTVMRGELTFQ